MARQRHLVPNVSAASVTVLILSDHYGVAVTVSPANALPRALVHASCRYFPSCIQNPHDNSDPDLPSS